MSVCALELLAVTLVLVYTLTLALELQHELVSAAIADENNTCERDIRANRMVCGFCSTEQVLIHTSTCVFFAGSDICICIWLWHLALALALTLSLAFGTGIHI